MKYTNYKVIFYKVPYIVSPKLTWVQVTHTCRHQNRVHFFFVMLEVVPLFKQFQHINLQCSSTRYRVYTMSKYAMFWYTLLYVYLYFVFLSTLFPHNFHNFTFFFYTSTMKWMLLSKNISCLNTVGHTKLYTDRNSQNKLTIYVRDLLNTKPEYSSCKTENAHNTFICCGPGWPQNVMWYTHTHTHTFPHHTYLYIVYDSPPQAGHKTPQPDALLIPCTPCFNTRQSTVSDTQFCTLA